MKLKCEWNEGCQPRFSQGDAGLDLRADMDLTQPIEPGQVVKISTGLRVEFPEGYCGLIFPRSSTGRDGLQIVNTVPVIDNTYRGTIELYVTSRAPLTLVPYERFAQLVLVPYYQVTELEYGEPRETERGDKGFGSSGRN